jgi:hypothetical protein
VGGLDGHTLSLTHCHSHCAAATALDFCESAAPRSLLSLSLLPLTLARSSTAGWRRRLGEPRARRPSPGLRRPLRGRGRPPTSIHQVRQPIPSVFVPAVGGKRSTRAHPNLDGSYAYSDLTQSQLKPATFHFSPQIYRVYIHALMLAC